MFARARFVGVEEAKALRRAQADGTKVEARMPEAIRARSIRSRCGRGWDLRDMAHAALRSGAAAAWTNCRIARLLNWKEISAEA